MTSRTKRPAVFFLFCALALVCADSLFSQALTHQWKTRRTSTGKESFLVALRIAKTDTGNDDNNVHQVFLTLKPHASQGTDLRFSVSAPNQTYNGYNTYELGGLLPASETYTFNYTKGYAATLSKTSGLDEWTLEIRFLPTTTNPSVFGCVGVDNHTQTTVDFFIQIKNVTLPGPAQGEFMSKVDLEAGTRTRAGYNAAPQATLGITGLTMDLPPTIAINSPALSDTTITAYAVPLSQTTMPYSFTATTQNESGSTNTIDNLQWQLKKPDLTTQVAAGTGPLNGNFDAFGFYELLYSVDEHVQSLFSAGVAPVQKAYGFVPIVVKYPPTANVTIANPPVGLVPFSTGNVHATITHNDPLPEVSGNDWADYDSNTTDYTVLGWEIKKDGVTTPTTISASTEDLTNQTIISGGKYTIKVKLQDDYGIQGEGSTDVFVQPVEKLAFPPASGVPFDNDEPIVDGITDYFDVNGNGVREPDANRDGLWQPGEDIYENGWTGASRLTFDNGTPAFIAFQSTRNRTMAANPYLYMSFEVNNDPSFDDNDIIVLNFRKDATSTDPADDRRIFIYPVYTGMGARENNLTDTDPNVAKYNKPPRLVEYWKKNASGAWIPAPSINTAGFDIKVLSKPEGGMWNYNVEIRLPTVKVLSSSDLGGADWIDLSDDFLFYFDVIRIDSTGPSPIAYELTWPRDLPIGYVPTGVLADYPFPVEVWGEAFKGATSGARGVSVEAWTDIGTDDGTANLSDAMKLSTENIFKARLIDTSEDVIPDPLHPGEYIVAPVEAKNVRATFSIAHWGINYSSPDWRQIPSTNLSYPNPTDLHNIPAGAGTDSTPKYDLESRWLLDSGDQTYYASHLHQCIKVELDSTSNTNILKKGASRNMNFAAGSSQFSQVARISTRGFGKPPAGKTKQTVILQVATKEWAVKKAIGEAKLNLASGSQTGQGQGVDSYLSYVVNGYIDTGRVIIINEKTYPIYMPMGSFGYYVHHDGDVSGWSHDIEGAQKLAPGVYKLEIDPESFKDVVTSIQSISAGFSLSLHAGVATPLGSFGNSYKSGFSAIIDFGYELSPLLSFILSAGYNYLPGASSGIAATSITNIALDARISIALTSTLFAYAQAGPNLYIQDFSTLNSGYNAGLGIGYLFSPRFRLEIGADYHSTFSQHNWMLQSHAGVVLRL